MWQCPKCKREFKNNNQDHFCEESPKTVEAYILTQPEEVRPLLQKVRETIRSVLPDAEEKISWSMPTFRKKQNIIHFAAFKNHMGLYPGSEAIEQFAEQLKPYKTSKGAIQFQYKEPVPFELIAEIATWCYITGNHH